MIRFVPSRQNCPQIWTGIYCWRVTSIWLRIVLLGLCLVIVLVRVELSWKSLILNVHIIWWSSHNLLPSSTFYTLGCTINLVPQAFYDHTSEGIDGSGRIEITNPPISISGLEPILDIIALPAFKTSDLISMEDPTEYDPLFAQYIKADENAMLNSTSLDGTTECNELPDFRNPIPYSAEGTLKGAFPSIFGTTTDPNGNAVVMIYDRHLTLYENTVENPVSIVLYDHLCMDLPVLFEPVHPSDNPCFTHIYSYLLPVLCSYQMVGGSLSLTLW